MSNHEFQLDLIITTIAQQPNAATLEHIAQRCGGLYPLELQAYLDELIYMGKIELCPSNGTYKVVQKNLVGNPSIITSTPDQFLIIPKSIYHNFNDRNILDKKHVKISLPAPHPHDYDWRFDTSTRQYITDLILKNTSATSQILFLGAPSIFVELANNSFHDSHLTNGQFIFIDWSIQLINYLSSYKLPIQRFRLIHYDLLSGGLWQVEQSVNLVVADPPWYPEYYNAFLAQAAVSTEIGAMILFSLLPVNTRPQAIHDRWQIFETAHKLGLHIQQVEAGSIGYDTPEFEAMSLGQMRLDVKNNWRTADLVIFRKVVQTDEKLARSIIEEAHKSVAQVTSNAEWYEVLINGHKIKLKGPFNDCDTFPELINIELNNILPSVSRRYEGREAIDLWLWDNRVFGVKGKAALRTALQNLAGLNVPHDWPEISNQVYTKALNIIHEVLAIL